MEFDTDDEECMEGLHQWLYGYTESTHSTDDEEQLYRSPISDGKSSTIRISPIPRGYTKSHIYDFIMTAISTPPLSMSLIYDKKKRIAKRKGHKLYDAQYCYVVLSSANDASQCAEKLNRKQFAGFDATVFVAAPSKNNVSQLKDKTNWIKITNINKSITEQEILSHIQNYGKIKSKPKNIYLFHHQIRDNYPGFAFIECQNNKDATKCVSNLCQTQLGGNKIYCEWRPIRKEFNRKEEELNGKTKQLILGNVHYTLKQNDILNLLTPFGQIEHVQMWYDKSGYPMGSCSITMGSVQDAHKVFNGLHGKKVKNLKIITGFTRIHSNKPQIINKTQTLSKSLIKNKNITKKMQIHSDGDTKKVFGGKKRSNKSKAFNKKMNRGKGGKGKGGKGKGMRKGPKFA